MEQKNTSNGRHAVGVPIELVEKIKALAKEEERSISNMVSLLIKEALTARGSQC